MDQAKSGGILGLSSTLSSCCSSLCSQLLCVLCLIFFGYMIGQNYCY